MKITYRNKQIERDSKTIEKQGWTIIDNLTNGLSGTPSGYVRLSKCPEVIIAVDKIANLISNMTIHLMENTDNGDQRVNNELSKKIDIYPCTNMTRKQWMFFIVKTLLLEGDGNAVVLPVYEERNGMSFIKDLIPVPAADFSIVLGKDFRDGYKIQIKDKKYDPEDLIHFVINPSMENPFKGKSYRIQLRELVNTLNNGENIKQEFLSNRYLPSVIISVDGDPDDITNSENKDRIVDKFVNSVGAAKPWVIPAELAKIEQIKPLSLNDIAITETLAQDKKTIAGILGVPAFLLGEGDFNRSEYNTFIKDTILSIAKVIEQTLTQKLLISPNYYFKFNIRSLYSYDLDMLADVGGMLFDKGVMTGNEVRDWIGLSPKEELDDLLILENYIPVKDSGNQKKLNSEQEGGSSEE